ncbi:protein arginine methyltransferase NDUFAF7, mitochondrial-like isoform X2 [Ornithodoros turicata]|uniref:protein arginine methyltransferase NDUFAF7, mitochondrial-like isoform X2 n=1 Tax=Ornithodoros turicata TaxID=34597 RepID=UPI00313A43B3
MRSWILRAVGNALQGSKQDMKRRFHSKASAVMQEAPKYPGKRSLVLEPQAKSSETKLLQQLRTRILASGPITVAEYMKEVLTNPMSGYYMHRDVFGSAGDFTTSPEISQMFGELIAVWFLNEWMKAGKPKPLYIVELGPGRGTLADDMLRVFSKYSDAMEVVSLHLVEISPHLSQIQELKLCGTVSVVKDVLDERPVHLRIPIKSESEEVTYKQSITKHGVPVAWYRHLHDVPRGFSCFIAHEFLDALPVHKFQRTKEGWRELFIDLDDGPGPHHLRYVLSRGPTPASFFTDLVDTEKRDHVEVCPEAGVIVQEIASRMHENGGTGLIVDYGHDGTKSDTFRAFKNHDLHPALSEPGTADLTADVDFSYLKKILSGKALTYGPVTQEQFLKSMGIDIRYQDTKPRHWNWTV